MKIIKSVDATLGVEKLASFIYINLNKNKRVLWLLSGGSNIPISVQVMNILKRKCDKESFHNLNITLTDERYGCVGHNDSNWQQLIDFGFDFGNMHTCPVLRGLSLGETTEKFEKNLSELIIQSDIVIGQFGIGTDGHIAGILPKTIGVESPKMVVVYDSPPFIRISITLETIRQIDAGFAFAFGESKRDAITNLKKQLSVEIEPAQVLKDVKEVYLYTDI